MKNGRKIVEHSLENMVKEVEVDVERWNLMPSEEDIAETAMNLRNNGIDVLVVEDAAEALAKLKARIPEGAEVMNGSSTTLAEIGFIDLIKSGNHGWKNLHLTILTEKDPARQADLRRNAVAAEYFLASPNAIAKSGEIVAWDASGSRTGAFNFAAKNLVLVAGVNKITGSFDEALARVREYVFKLENARAKKVYGSGSSMNKLAVIAKEGTKGRVTMILVKDQLGY